MGDVRTLGVMGIEPETLRVVALSNRNIQVMFIRCPLQLAGPGRAGRLSPHPSLHLCRTRRKIIIILI